MIKTLTLAVLLGTALVAPAKAEQVTISRAAAAGSLHEGPLDMVAYWTAAWEGVVELTATFRARTPEAEPMRVVLPLADGDGLGFAMPGYPTALYRFSREGRHVRVAVDTAPEQLAAR